MCVSLMYDCKKYYEFHRDGSFANITIRHDFARPTRKETGIWRQIHGIFAAVRHEAAT